jgi:hypothetical protein
LATRNLPPAAALLVALSACSSAPRVDEYASSLPDYEGLALELQDDGVAALSVPLATAATFPDTGAGLAAAHDAIARVNRVLHTYLDPVAALTPGGGRALGADGRIYGPADRCVVGTGPGCAAASFVLVVRRRDLGGFSWVLGVRSIGSAADFVPVAGGWLIRYDVAHRGVGVVALDLGKLGAVVPGFPGQGTVAAAFANGLHAKALRFRLVGFTPDGLDPVTAAYAGHRTAEGLARVRVAALRDLVAPPAGASTDELLLVHAVWKPDVGGRSYAVVTDWAAGGSSGGDLAAATYLLGRACYAPATAGRLYEEWRSCDPVDGVAISIATCLELTPTVVAGSGDWATSCGAPVEGMGDPGVVVTDPDDARDEDGASAIGEPPPPPDPIEVVGSTVPT